MWKGHLAVAILRVSVHCMLSYATSLARLRPHCVEKSQQPGVDGLSRSADTALGRLCRAMDCFKRACPGGMMA